MFSSMLCAHSVCTLFYCKFNANFACYREMRSQGSERQCTNMPINCTEWMNDSTKWHRSNDIPYAYASLSSQSMMTTLVHAALHSQITYLELMANYRKWNSNSSNRRYGANNDDDKLSGLVRCAPFFASFPSVGLFKLFSVFAYSKFLNAFSTKHYPIVNEWYVNVQRAHT